MQLTAATLAVFSKYPGSSSPAGDEDKPSEKKFGYFQSESTLFAEVADRVGLRPKADRSGAWCRHPLAVLLEAADDICYRIIDLEDAYRIGIIPLDMARELLGAIANASPDPASRATLAQLLGEDEEIGYLRAKAINNLIHQAAEVWVENYNALMDGTYERTLMSEIESSRAVAILKRTSQELIFPHRPVVEIEAAGFRILGGLLSDFVSCGLKDPTSLRSEKILSLLPREIRPEANGEKLDTYEWLMRIAQFVAGMTDEFAIRCYRVLRGIELPTS